MDTIINYLNTAFFVFRLMILLFILLLILPYILNIISLFTYNQKTKVLRSMSRSLKKSNEKTFKTIVNIFKALFCLIRFKVFINPKKLRESILRLSPEKFESFCADIYKKLGYKSTITQFGNDGGKDIILTDENNIVTYVECKRWHPELNPDSIGREICQKLIGSCMSDGVKNAIIITTGKIHENAFKYQTKLNKNSEINLEIINFDGLIELYLKAYKMNQEDSSVCAESNY